MTSEDKRDVADGTPPSTSGSAISFRKTPEEIKLDLKDTWTTRILVSTGPVAGITSGIFLGRLFRRNPKLVLDIAQWALKRYGIVKNLWRGSIIIELDCGSQEKYLKFQEDFKDGKVKDALEEELRKIGCHVELKLTLMERTSTVAAIETSEGTVDQESGETSFDELVKKAEQMWHQRAGHHLNTCAAEVKQEWREEPDNLALLGTCKGSVDQRAEKTSFATEIKKAEQMRHQGAATNTEERIFEGRAEEMQQESQGKRPSARKRVTASGSTEVKQEEKSGSAAKKSRLDPTGEPGTSGVSNTRKTRKFKVVVKKGNPDNDELEQLANDIDPSDWKKVARKLKIHDPKITAIHKENEEFHEKIYQMLLKWKQANGSAATWKKLNQALIDAGLRELAEKHCCKKTN